MREWATSFGRDSRGTAAIAFALSVPILAGAASAAVVYSHAANVKAAQERALDVAVLAAASLPIGTSDSERTRLAETVFTSASSERFANSVSEVWPSFQVQNDAAGMLVVSGTVRSTVPTIMGGLLGVASLPVNSAAAAKKGQTAPVCVYALNRRENGAVDLNGTVDVSSDCPAQANSLDKAAVRAVGAAKMSTTAFAVSGDVRGSEAFSPPASTQARQLPDPFEGIPFPLAGICSPLSGASIKEDAALLPGTYCGGVQISSGAKVRLASGVYIFKDGSLKIEGGAQVTGEEVLLAFGGKGAKFWMTGGASMTVTSPKSGMYANMQFMEDRQNLQGDTWVSIGGDSFLSYDGVMYFPLSNIWIFGGSVVQGNSPNVIMLGDKLWFQDNSKVTLTQRNPRNLNVPATARLEQSAILVR